VVELTKADDSADVVVGLAELSAVQVGASPTELRDELARAVARAKTRSDDDVAAVRSAVRNMLRYARYKPTGRAKPASEYLLGAAREDRFPTINNLVDINNLVSLEFLLPISIVDLERNPSLERATPSPVERFVLRRGRAGESYLFNETGQAIDLCDLLLVARLPDDTPCANPVKDSMATKVVATTRRALGVIYAPSGLHSRLGEALQAFGNALERWSGGAVSTRIV
jgi:DNA/RNA-binding domain of Phe-tRNA-synthetase-like protein